MASAPQAELNVGKSENRIVQFKEFSVRDDRCAMKIGTDALLLASWCSADSMLEIVDLGCGSGIIALMVAQRASQARVVGVELEENAAKQASSNMAVSPFSNRMEAILQSAQQFARQSDNKGKFDLVVCNPPYFHGKPKSPVHARNLARHDESFTLKELLMAAQEIMKLNGRLALAWPMDRKEQLMQESLEMGFALARYCEIAGTTNHEPKRFLSEWKKSTSVVEARQPVEKERLNIESTSRISGKPQHSARYKELLAPFVKDWG